MEPSRGPALEFYQRDTVDVARDLLGLRLVREFPDGRRLSGVIVETEAYLGAEDPACHTFRGRRTPRTEAMYLPGGHAYVYFIYGIYFCFNVVTRGESDGEAVLIRALDLNASDASRPAAARSASGPGKLCTVLEIDRRFNGHRLDQSPLWLGWGSPAAHTGIVSGARIGISASAGDAVHWPLRFGLRDHPCLSRPFREELSKR